MWFADIGVILGWAALAVWLSGAVLAYALPRYGATRPALVLTSPGRLPLVVGAGAFAVLFAIQAGVVDTVADTPGAGVLDEAVWSWFVDHRTATLTVVMRLVSTVGNTAGTGALAVIGAVVLWLRRRRVEAAVVLVAALGAAALVKGFKTLYDRPRPPVAQQLTLETNQSLPSGHSLLSIVVLGVLAAVVITLTRRVILQVLAAVVAVAGVAVIGVSRLYLGVHWMTDVLTGWVLGGAWLAACVTAMLVLRGRITDHGGVPFAAGVTSPRAGSHR